MVPCSTHSLEFSTRASNEGEGVSNRNRNSPIKASVVEISEVAGSALNGKEKGLKQFNSSDKARRQGGSLKRKTLADLLLTNSILSRRSSRCGVSGLRKKRFFSRKLPFCYGKQPPPNPSSLIRGALFRPVFNHPVRLADKALIRVRTAKLQEGSGESGCCYQQRLPFRGGCLHSMSAGGRMGTVCKERRDTL
ncbi:hypothetical protein AVEN_76003-1 [Araneus ventricosus]|uniref:Uncharacterized protein n=1 Tax=Araneus ventricosus TaxID=182803 RepID=A0A4Y2FA47_ARAVE|nr:hypothetical protein AVEN_76003-1 [Araneus ventricosus]